MIQELSIRLSKAIEQIRLKEKLERDLLLLDQEIQKRSVEFASTGKLLEKEKVDVEKLERTNLTALFYTVLGSREQQLEQERQELLSIQLQYQQSKSQLEYLEQKHSILLQQLDELEGIETEYQRLLLEKEQILRQTDQAISREIVEYTEKITQLNVDVKEMVEAISAGNDVIASLDQVIKSLERAENWGTWDMLGGGLLTTAIKHSRIDDAQKYITSVQRSMNQFTRELTDIRPQVEIRIDLGSFESFADYFFDSLIVDWVIQAKISGSLDRAEQAKEIIAQAVKELEVLKKNTQKRQRELQARRVQIIEST